MKTTIYSVLTRRAHLLMRVVNCCHLKVILKLLSRNIRQVLLFVILLNLKRYSQQTKVILLIIPRTLIIKVIVLRGFLSNTGSLVARADKMRTAIANRKLKVYFAALENKRHFSCNNIQLRSYRELVVNK